jgi:penicillin-binding protein 2
MTKLLPPNREPKELRPRAAVMAVIACALFLVLIGRLYYLQLVRGEEFSLKSRENYVKDLPEPASRGLILDHRGRLIADNRASFDVYVTPAFCKHQDDVLGRLFTRLNLMPDEADAVLKAVRGFHGLDRFRPYLVKRDIPRDQLDLVQNDLSQLEGIDVIPSAHRDYLYGSDLAHVVGYLSEVSEDEYDAAKGKYRRGDFLGRRGIERSMEKELRGIDGRRRIAVDAKGRELDKEFADQLIPEDERRVPSQPGHNVVLSIDLGLQRIAEQALKEGAQAGVVVAVDVHTGFVLAMVSEPSYDPNMLTGRISRKDLKSLVDDPLQPLFQRAVQQHYHPGSTFKIVTALAALESGLITPESTTSCGGGYTLGARRWRCHKDSGHGSGINLRRALMVSCDTYFYWLADRLGLDAIAEAGQKLGFGHTTGIELSPEAPGVMPTEAFHDRVDHGYTKGFALNAAIGQGSVNVTPLQLAMAYAAIANGGTLYRPRLVRRIEDWQGHVVKEFEPEIVHELGMKPAYQAAIMDGLIAVANEPGGTAYGKRLADVRIAAKTGTAQNVEIKEIRTKLKDMEWATRDHAWIATIAPAEDPEIVVVVLNEHGGHGGAAAGPIAMAVIEGYFDLKKRESDAKQILSQQEIMELKPNPRYVGHSLASKDRPLSGEAGLVSGASPVTPDETPAKVNEVADPSLLEDRKPVANAPAEGLRPTPEKPPPPE